MPAQPRPVPNQGRRPRCGAPIPGPPGPEACPGVGGWREPSFALAVAGTFHIHSSAPRLSLRLEPFGAYLSDRSFMADVLKALGDHPCGADCRSHGLPRTVGSFRSRFTTTAVGFTT